MFSILIAQRVEREKLVLALWKANEILSLNTLTDTTTQLPNRRALMGEMGRYIASTASGELALIVAFIDLDHFKTINDDHGHDTGDQLLAAIGARIQGAVRSSDFVARLGGDEFVALVTVARRDAEATASALRAKLQAAGAGQFRLDNRVIDYVGPSIGLIIVDPGTRDATTLLAQADAAMYVDKRARRHRHALHQPAALGVPTGKGHEPVAKSLRRDCRGARERHPSRAKVPVQSRDSRARLIFSATSVQAAPEIR